MTTRTFRTCLTLILVALLGVAIYAVWPSGSPGPVVGHAAPKAHKAPHSRSVVTYSPPATIPHTCAQDATTALNTWLSSLPAFATANLPSGACYLVSNSPSSLLTIRGSWGLTINGNGSTFKQTYKPTGNAQVPVLTVGGNVSLTVNNLTVRGLSGTGGGNVEGDAGILMWQNAGVALNSVTITSVEGDGLDVYPLGNKPGVNWYVSLNHSTISDVGYHAIVPEAADYFSVSNSTISDGDIDAEVDFNCQGNLPNCGTLSSPAIGVVNMTFNGDSFPNGMSLEDGLSCMPVGNWMIENSNFGTGGLRAEFDTTYSLTLSALQSCGQYSGLTITGNTDTNTTLPPCCGGASPYMPLQGWTNVTIANNHFVYALNRGLGGGAIADLWGDTNVHIENNVFANWYNLTADNAPAGWPATTGTTVCGNTTGSVQFPVKSAACS
jgi:hypothetical protein